MAFSINTNIASLQAQEYLRVSGDFQNKTINKVTSGLRIVNSGDDAAGLAVANSIRSDRSVLSQGIRNANDGLATLQTIDGGINNISQLLDRARTLAAQSASGAFTGNRNTLNEEFKSLVTEIDRQAQSIGLDSGGAFAKTVSVFLGGGRANGNITQATNGSVAVDLSKSTVNSQALGLKGVQAIGVEDTDIGSGLTKVSTILADATNVASATAAGKIGFTDFFIQGAGFAGSDKIKVSVDTAGVTNTTTLASAINTAIELAGVGTTANKIAFDDANIKASINTDAAGKQQLTFSSSNAAFQVQAGDRLANALLGNFSGGATGVDLANTVTGGTNTLADAAPIGAYDVVVRFEGSGLEAAVDLTVTIGGGDTPSTVVTALRAAIAANSALAAAGITLDAHTDTTKLGFTSSHGEQFTVSAAGDTENVLGLGTLKLGGSAGTSFDYTAITAAAAVSAVAADNQVLEFSVGGGATFSLGVAAVGVDIDAAVTNLTAVIGGNATATAAGITVTKNVAGDRLILTSTNGTAFRLNATVDGTDVFGFGNTGVVDAPNVQSAIGTKSSFNSNGAANSALNDANDVYTFNAIRYGNDDQTITISAPDSAGIQQSLAVILRNDDSGRNARSLDEAVETINAQLQQSPNDTLRKIVAVKELNAAGTAEGIRFLSTNGSFDIKLGDTVSGLVGGAVGLSDNTEGTYVQDKVYNSEISDGGAATDVSSQTSAILAVSVLAEAVGKLGEAQANVGKGQNQFNFAINLASTQLTNLSAAESRIRDADLAQESANLTKASISLQAGLAALAQANSAPQAVLALLRG